MGSRPRERSVAVSVAPATLADAHALAPLMRAEDAAEVLASGGYTPLQALTAGLEAPGAHTLTVRFGAEVAGMLGTLPLPTPRPLGLLAPRVGVVWLLTGRAVRRHPVTFLRCSRILLPHLFGPYDVLTNHVDARYLGAVRWLSSLGARLSPAEPFGAAGLPFHRFTLHRS